jgi:prepilin-type processing-associated H-X9-DG protein
MSEVPPVLQPSKTEKLVQSSFVLGIASIACGITALPAIIQSIRALIHLRKETVSKSAFRKVIFSLIFSSCILAFIIFSIASAFYAAQGLADRINCVNNMKQLGLLMRIYRGDNYDRYPTAQWCDIILTNKFDKAELGNLSTNIAKMVHCPSAPRNERCSYAFNRQLVGIKDTDQIAQDTVMLFESDAGWNAVGGPEIIAKRHNSGLNVALIDGSVLQIQGKDIPSLRWNPYTNSTAK